MTEPMDENELKRIEARGHDNCKCDTCLDKRWLIAEVRRLQAVVQNDVAELLSLREQLAAEQRKHKSQLASLITFGNGTSGTVEGDLKIMSSFIAEAKQWSEQLAAEKRRADNALGMLCEYCRGSAFEVGRCVHCGKKSPDGKLWIPASAAQPADEQSDKLRSVGEAEQQASEPTAAEPKRERYTVETMTRGSGSMCTFYFVIVLKLEGCFPEYIAEFYNEQRAREYAAWLNSREGE